MHTRPIYTCYRTSEPIVVDGKLDEPSWQAAEPIHLVLTETGAAPRFPTTAKMLWDDHFLYVSFHCIDADIWGTVTEHDGPMYQEEVVEVFIDANRDGISYVELEVNPLNISLDLFALNRGDKTRTLFDWTSADWQHAVTVDGHLNQRDQTDKSWTEGWPYLLWTWPQRHTSYLWMVMCGESTPIASNEVKKETSSPPGHRRGR